MISMMILYKNLDYWSFKMVLDEFKSIDLEKFPEAVWKTARKSGTKRLRRLFKMGETTAQP